MKNKYLLCGLLLALLFAGCKKNNFDDNGPDTNIGKEIEGYKPIIVDTIPRLVNLRINGASCGFDRINNIYYFPVTSGGSLDSYTVNFDSTAATAVIINGQRVASGGTINYSLKTKATVKVRVINSLNTPADYDLVITNLPIVKLTITDPINDEGVNAYFELVDPDYRAHGGNLRTVSNIRINLRGASARNLPQKAYAVHMNDAGGNDRDVTLLGLRDDNNWILDAMYIDPARMRNRLCTDIWNSFNNVPHIADEPEALNGTRGYMVEVFYNEFYHGLYCLTEKLDRKQLKVKKLYGNMYKADESTTGTNFLGVSPFDNQSKLWGGWELEYPDLGDTPSPNWAYLYNETNFLANSNDAEFLADIKNRVDINNMVDYFIFMNIIRATDNDAKNTFFSFYDIRTAPAFFYSPWDLDGTMGRDWAGLKVSNTVIGPGTNNLFIRLLNLNAQNFKGLVKNRWNQLKANQLSKATVAGRITGYKNLLTEAGAFDRERDYAIDSYDPLDLEAAYMTTFYSAQFDLFDAYINNL
jgi:hypothetical protein